MKSSIELKTFNYKFDAGPLVLKELKEENFKEGNCRLAIQYYLYKVHQKYFKPSYILNPRGYFKTGRFIIEEGGFNKNSLKILKEGDIIYAERINKETAEKPKRKDWVISLHSAIYLGRSKIWHSSKKAKGTSTWSFSKFLRYYTPIAAKRFIS